jgi:hypothetical protein
MGKNSCNGKTPVVKRAGIMEARQGKVKSGDRGQKSLRLRRQENWIAAALRASQ